MKDPRTLAERVRNVCIDEALRAYEDAGISGLCAEGRWECAVQAVRALDPDELLRRAGRGGDPLARSRRGLV